jgi:hypothetical protein
MSEARVYAIAMDELERFRARSAIVGRGGICRKISLLQEMERASEAMG